MFAFSASDRPTLNIHEHPAWHHGILYNIAPSPRPLASPPQKLGSLMRTPKPPGADRVRSHHVVHRRDREENGQGDEPVARERGASRSWRRGVADKGFGVLYHQTFVCVCDQLVSIWMFSAFGGNITVAVASLPTGFDHVRSQKNRAHIR